MYRKTVSAILLCVIAATAIFIIVRAQPSEGGSVASSASAATTAPPSDTAAAASEPAATSTPTTESTTAPTQTSDTQSGTTKSLKQILSNKGIDPSREVISIAVDKSDHTLEILANGQPMKSYHVELGEGGQGDKEISGDHKTPEGTFYITERSVLSPADYYLGSRWMELSYPNIEDADRGLSEGIISQETHDSIVSAINNGKMPPQNTALGGGVGIHGGSVASFGSNWTWGCVGLANKDVEDFYSYIKVGTKVVITK